MPDFTRLDTAVQKFRTGSPNIAAAFDEVKRLLGDTPPPTPPPVPPTPGTGFRWSEWDKPIPQSPTLDPSSATVVQALAPQQFMVIKADYTIPIYRATSSTLRRAITLTAEWNVGKQLTNCPYDAVWRPSPGEDAHMCVIDHDGCEYDYWGWGWQGPGTAGSATTFVKGGTGFATHGQACRAGGSALTAGLILGSEIKAGHIPHALAFACATATRAGNVVAPATDGYTSLPTTGARIPMGGRIQLDPAADISSYPSSTRTILRALQEYGAFMVDGGGFGFFAEDELTAGPYAGWPVGGSFMLPAAMKPRLRVLKHGPSVPKTPRQYNGPETCPKSRVV